MGERHYIIFIKVNTSHNNTVEKIKNLRIFINTLLFVLNTYCIYIVYIVYIYNIYIILYNNMYNYIILYLILHYIIYIQL